MNEEKKIMEFQSVLPEDFDGTFYFTNWTDEDFIGRWAKREYTFPANATSPIIMHDQTPLEIQQIRKKFAKDLAEREFAKGPEYMRLISQEKNPDGSARLNSIHMAGSYSINSLASLIQRALEPLPVKKATVKKADAPVLEEKLSKNEEGELNTEAIDKKTSLRDKALTKK